MSPGVDLMGSGPVIGSYQGFRASHPLQGAVCPPSEGPSCVSPDRCEIQARNENDGCHATPPPAAAPFCPDALPHVCQALPLSNPLDALASTAAQQLATPRLQSTEPPAGPLAGSGLTPAAVEAYERLAQGSRGFVAEGDWECQPSRGGWTAILAPDGPPTSHALNSVVFDLHGLQRPRFEWTADYFLSDGGADNRVSVEVRGADGTWTGHRFEVDDGFEEYRVIDLSRYVGQKIQVRFRAENKCPSPPPIYEDDYYYRVRDVRLTGLDAAGAAARRDDLGSDYSRHLLSLATAPVVGPEERSALLVHLASLAPGQALERVAALADNLAALPPADAAQAIRQSLESHLVGVRREASPVPGTIETSDGFVTIGGIPIPRRN